MTDFNDSQTFAYLNHLSTEKLEELLTAAHDPYDEETSAYYDAIEEVILRREKESPTGRLSDLDASWKEFCSHYVNQTGEAGRPYPDDAPDAASDAAASSIALNRSEKRRPNFRKRFIAVAAGAAAVFAMIVAVQASGFDLLGWLGRWTEDVLWFNSDSPDTEKSPSTQSSQAYDTIQAAVEKCGITAPVVPTWFPDGYELDEANYAENQSTKYVFCQFSNQDEGWIHFRVTNYETPLQSKTSSAEKDTSTVGEYVSNDQLFYITNNVENSVVSWSSGTWFASIEGTISEEEIKTMIDSIGG